MQASLRQPVLYRQRVDEVCPKTDLIEGCLKAFIVGGLISMLGQLLIQTYMNLGASRENAAAFNSITLIFLGSLVTGLGWYDNLGKFAGAGSIIPITGFANGIVASAVEHKKEGFILGLGPKLFAVAGPVIVYGLLSSSFVGLIAWLIGGRL